MLRTVFYDKEDVSVISIPDTESVNWGRGVGYELNEFIPPSDLAAISATTIRNEIKGVKKVGRKWSTLLFTRTSLVI
jgi:hypothetical protein